MRKKLCLFIILCITGFSLQAAENVARGSWWGLGIFVVGKGGELNQGVTLGLKGDAVALYAELGMNPPIVFGDDAPETISLLSDMMALELDWRVFHIGSWDFRIGGNLLYQGFSSEKLHGETAWRYTLYPSIGCAVFFGNMEIYGRVSHSRLAPTKIVSYKDTLAYPQENYMIGKVSLSYYF